MQAFRSRKSTRSGLLLSTSSLTSFVSGQSAVSISQDPVAAETWSFVVMIVIGAVFIAAAGYWLVKRRSSAEHISPRKGNSLTPPASGHRRRKGDNDGRADRLNQARAGQPADVQPLTLNADLFRQKVEQLRFSQLPINSIFGLRPAKEFEPLPISDDESLLDAIEQSQDESETDEDVCIITLRVLAAFKNRNSVDAISQIALYDLQPRLRAKAVSELAKIDHESVFEAILLACADPTKEVRAAAARALFHLSFDRTDAWHRIAETGDELRMRQAARAAIEADLVGRSFDRLVYDDAKVAYEAFALATLLIKSGETAPIFDAIENHPDQNVRFALLQVLRVLKDESVVSDLKDLLETGSLNAELKEKIKEVIFSFEPLEV